MDEPLATRSIATTPTFNTLRYISENCGNVRRGSYLRGRAAGEAARENETESQDIVIIYLRERERINGSKIFQIRISLLRPKLLEIRLLGFGLLKVYVQNVRSVISAFIRYRLFVPFKFTLSFYSS